MIIENKINEDGYTGIINFHLQDGYVLGVGDDNYIYIIKYIDGGIYILDKPINVNINTMPLPISSREDLSILFKSMKNDRRNKGMVVDNEDQLYVVCNDISVVIDALIIVDNDEIKGMYCLINELVYELHITVDNYGRLTGAHTGSMVGRVENDAFILDISIHVNTPIIYAYTIKDVMSGEVKFMGKHYKR